MPRGFTVIELMMATAIFSIVLLIGMTGFVQVSRAYYKGLTISQTKSTATSIMNEISANIRLDSGVSSLNTASASRYYYCIGSHRYTFKLLNMVDTSNHDNASKFGLLEDELAGSNGCGNPFDAPTVPLVNPKELLGNQMRLLAFDVTAVSGNTNLYTVNVKVGFGQDNTLTSPISASSQCRLQLGGNQFCAITSLSTIVYGGI